jgi:hypothetical protein
MIVAELGDVVKKTLKDLEDLNKNIDDMVSNSSEISYFIEAFNEAAYLDKKINALYTYEDDKKQIGIKK